MDAGQDFGAWSRPPAFATRHRGGDNPLRRAHPSKPAPLAAGRRCAKLPGDLIASMPGYARKLSRKIDGFFARLASLRSFLTEILATTTIIY